LRLHLFASDPELHPDSHSSCAEKQIPSSLFAHRQPSAVCGVDYEDGAGFIYGGSARLCGCEQ
jgi:hypothetical protein